MKRINTLVRRVPNVFAVWALFLIAWSAKPLLADETPPLALSPRTAEQVQNVQRQWAQHIGTEIVHTNAIGMKLVLLPPGEFTMGMTEEQLEEQVARLKNDPQRQKNYGGNVVWAMLEMPAHRVRLTKPFCLGATEVTVGQFRQFTAATGYKTEAEQGLNGGEPYKSDRPICTWRKPMVWIHLQQKDDEPVLHLCYNDCVAFCKWLSDERVEYGLPTEAEWEYGCRAGTTTPWYFGGVTEATRVGHEYAWWSEEPQGKHDRPRSVAQGKPNAFGLYDMHGNVWEYVADWWHRMYYKESPLNDPTGPDTQDELNRLRRIIRGSSFDWDRSGGESYYRMRIGQQSNQHPHMGFRVALRIKGIQGVPPAVDPQDELRRKKRDPGADSAEVVAALKAAAEKEYPKALTVELGRTAERVSDPSKKQDGSETPSKKADGSETHPTGGVKMEFVLIPPGSFLMGSEKGFKDEAPVHRIVISKPFYMAKYELTQSQWEALMGKHPWLEELRPHQGHRYAEPDRLPGLYRQAQGPGPRPRLRPADRGAVGIRLPRRKHRRVPFRRRCGRARRVCLVSRKHELGRTPRLPRQTLLP
jgi:sulfatase modifying factor 1